MNSGEGKTSTQKSSQNKSKNDRQRTVWHIFTFNTRTLGDEEKVLELEQEIKKINWTIIGLSEVRRKGENCITLKSGHKLFYKRNKEQKLGGV